MQALEIAGRKSLLPRKQAGEADADTARVQMHRRTAMQLAKRISRINIPRSKSNPTRILPPAYYGWIGFDAIDTERPARGPPAGLYPYGYVIR